MAFRSSRTGIALLLAASTLVVLGTGSHGAPVVPWSNEQRTPPTTTLPWDSSPEIPTAVFEASNGVLSGRLELRPPTPVLGELVTARMITTDMAGGILMSRVIVGERLPTAMHMTVDCVPPQDRRPSRPNTDIDVEQFVIDLAGRLPLRAVFRTTRCESRDEVIATGLIDVAPAVVPANSRDLPTATVRETVNTQPGGYYGREFTAEVHDDDGYLDTVVFHWGDGRPPTVAGPNPAVRCELYPMRFLPGAGYPQSVSGHHEFTGPGRFVVRAVVTTTACGGGNPQTTDAEWVVEMP